MAPHRKTGPRKGFRKQKTPTDSVDLRNIYKAVGDNLNTMDIGKLTCMYEECMVRAGKPKIRDGYSFFLALEKTGKCDLSNFRQVVDLLKIINRFDLANLVTFEKRATVCSDPVDDYLSSLNVPLHQSAVAPARRPNHRRSSLPMAARRTCDVRLRVRAEYCSHDAALQNIISDKVDPMEKQLDIFTQASLVLKSRDLGSIICDIKFSELTYLDAFWRDYVNGSLHEALKGVFLTESLKQAVHHEDIKLLVSVDENDYDKGRLLLLQNLENQDAELNIGAAGIS